MPILYYILPVLIVAVIAGWKRKINLAVLLGCMFFIFSYTVLIRKSGKIHTFGLTPFWSYRALFGDGYSPIPRNELIVEIIGNIVMFIPIGLLSGNLIGWKSIILGCVFSALIEVIQLLTGKGVFEFDDIMHNTLGTVTGYGMALGYQCWMCRLKTRCVNDMKDGEKA